MLGNCSESVQLSNPDDEECDGAVDSGGVTAADSQFCERFGLPMDQRPLDGRYM